MTKLTAKQYQQFLLLNVLLTPTSIGISLFLIQRVSSPLMRFLLWAELGFYLVFIGSSLYRLLNKQAFKRALTARNDERYQLIKDRARLTAYHVMAGVLGACFSFDALGHFMGFATLNLAIWEFVLILVCLSATAYALAKLWYQQRL